jgi:hypothetical protein
MMFLLLSQGKEEKALMCHTLNYPGSSKRNLTEILGTQLYKKSLVKSVISRKTINVAYLHFK